MSEASIYCYGCKRYWRPEHISTMNKRKRAPDGGPSGRCRACQRASQKRHYQNVRRDPERYALLREKASTRERARRAAMTDDERRAMWKRQHERRDPAKLKASQRRYWEQHRDEIRAKQRVYRRAQRQARPEHIRALESRRWIVRKARRFARIVASARAPQRAAGGGAS